MMRLYLALTIFITSCGLVYWFLYIKPAAPTHVVIANFHDLPRWHDAKLANSFLAFKRSCHLFLKQPADKSVGNKYIPLTVKDWLPACRAANKIEQSASNERILSFFQRWFRPVAFVNSQQIVGLFTGYYMPMLEGSLSQTAEFKIPLYAKPSDLIKVPLAKFDSNYSRHDFWIGRAVNQTLRPYYTRKQIESGALKQTTPVIAWIKSKVDRHFLEIEGSGVIKLNNKKKIYVGYAGQNGAKYTPIANVLIRKGVLTKDTASMQAIKRYLASHPDEADSIMHENKSFVFFERTARQGAIGAQNVVLTDGYSLAVDRHYIPLGTPLWLCTKYPNENTLKPTKLHRLMIAQDSGGAIRGPVRGDVYWGEGERAEKIAGHMRHQGVYWLLVPKSAIGNIMTH